jgi:haloacetate dehalogenase
VLWSAAGAVGTWYQEEGGPLAVWREWATRVEGQAVSGGHFFPEETPDLTADLLRRFFRSTSPT